MREQETFLNTWVTHRSHFPQDPALYTLTESVLPRNFTCIYPECGGRNRSVTCSLKRASASYHIWVIPTPWSSDINNFFLPRWCPVQNIVYTLPRIRNIIKISPVIAVLSDIGVIRLWKQDSCLLYNIHARWKWSNLKEATWRLLFSLQIESLHEEV